MDETRPMTKQEMLKQPYPRNMLMTLVEGTIEMPEITDDIMAGIEYVLSELTEREREVLRQRYEERKTYTAIADSLGVCKSRIPQNEHHAFRAMRYKRNMGFLLYGKEGFAARHYIFTFPNEPIPEPPVPDPAAYIITIEALDLSVGATNRLLRAGLGTVKDLINLSSENILTIKGLSQNNRIEIARKLYTIGFRDMAWDEYLTSIPRKR